MKPKLIHQEAMEYSFKAKQALNEADYMAAFELYKKAADLESQVAEFYFDKPELEPTRSVLIRSAAFLNLKAGLIENAQKFIFFGLLNATDELIKTQLNNALELSVSLKNMSPEAASGEFNYLNLLRQRSVNYILEPVSDEFGKSVSLQMVKDFSENFLKSLKAYAVANFKKIVDVKEDVQEAVIKEIESLVNPLLTNSQYGSFKFSIANDFLKKPGEEKDIVKLKSNIINNYHQEVFINPLTDPAIANIKENYSSEEINQIFRPLTKIKANNSTYRVGYYDADNFNKVFLNRIVNAQRKKLLPINQITQEDIGELESSIVHRRSSATGKVSKKTIFSVQMKEYDFDIKTNQIEPKDISPLILSDDILLNVNFNSDNGFLFSFADVDFEYADTEYGRGFAGFNNEFYKRIVYLANMDEKDMSERETKDWSVLRKLIGNPDSLKNK